MPSAAKTLVFSLGVAIVLYCTYAVFQPDDYEVKIQQKVNLNSDVALQKIADLNTWPEWTEPESNHLRYQIDTGSAEPILRWMSASIVTKETLTDTNAAPTEKRQTEDGQPAAKLTMIGYRQLNNQQDNRLSFTVRDGSMAVYNETIVVESAGENSSLITWTVQSSSSDIVEKLYRPAVAYFIKSRYEGYLPNLKKLELDN